MEPTCGSSITNTELAQQLEELEKETNEVVNTITGCIDAIRSVQEFHPSKDLSKVLQSNDNHAGRSGTHRVHSKSDLVNMVFLYQRLEDMGLTKEIQKVCCKKNSPDDCGDASISGDVRARENIEDHRHPLQRDREKVVYEIFLPLLYKLVVVFNALDKAQEDMSIPTTNHDSKSQQLKKQKPRAPRGLLSLSNYTDIACLLELTVCTSIVPLLEQNILRPAADRVKYLPKTLAGRLYRKSLLWGSQVFHDVDAYDTTESSRRHPGEVSLKIEGALKELSAVVITITKVLMMDRFRPMLLPRHLTDIHAALFQIERLVLLRKAHSLSSTRNDWSSIISPELTMIMQLFTTGKVNKDDSNSNQHQHSLNRIDLHTMARSFQSLLQSGKVAPPWIKSRVSKLLTDMAISSSEGFTAIIDVFVVAAASLPTEQITSASARLGRVLCAKPPKVDNVDSFNYYEALFDRALEVLIFHYYNFAKDDASADNRVVSSVLTVWSLLENLPSEITRPLFYHRLVNCIITTTSAESVNNMCSLRNAIRQITSLLLFPPNGDVAIRELCIFILSDRHCTSRNIGAPGSVSVLSQLIRIATARGNQAIQAEVVSEAEMAINQIIYATLMRWSIGKDAKIRNDEFLVISILRSVATNALDMDGYLFERTDRGVTLKKRCDMSPTAFLLDLENRASFIVNSIMSSEKENSKIDTNDKHQSADDDVFYAMDRLTGAFFELQLLIYFQATYTHESTRMLPISLISNIGDYKVLSMMLLPMLFEKCSPRRLFAERQSSSSGIFRVISLIISSTFQLLNDDSDSSSGKNLDLIGTHLGYEYYDSIQCPFESIDTEVHDVYSSTVDAVHGLLDVDVESQLSTTSLVLSILLAILELGSHERKENEEMILKQLVPSLSSLSTVQDLKCRTGTEANETSTSAVLQSEIAEMASYAAALIEARSSKLSGNKNVAEPKITSEQDNLTFQLDNIRVHILSDQPPVRAYAVCELRKLAKGILQKIKDLPKADPYSFIESLEESQTSLSPKLLLDLADDILATCISSLTDAESYVYLACIQTIVSMADEIPRHFIPVIIKAISSGNFAKRQQQSSEDTIALTSEHRVKLAEAMTFIIRRRGQAVDCYAMTILNTLLYGKDRVANTARSEEGGSNKLIQVETERYFHGNAGNMTRDECDDQDELYDEKVSRLKTGGPIFRQEENDVLRSACISVVSELLSAANPSSLANFCPTIIPLAVDALKLDHSRLVRRAAAMLSREIYNCALSESNSIDLDHTDNSSLSFNVSLLQNGEDALYTTLKRATAGDDLDWKIDGTTVVNAVAGKSRLYDPSTVTRCQEALGLREELERIGTMHLAALIMKSKKETEDSFIKRFISLETGEKSTGNLLL